MNKKIIAKTKWISSEKSKPELGDQVLVCFGEKNTIEFIPIWMIKHATGIAKFKFVIITNPTPRTH